MIPPLQTHTQLMNTLKEVISIRHSVLVPPLQYLFIPTYTLIIRTFLKARMGWYSHLYMSLTQCLKHGGIKKMLVNKLLGIWGMYGNLTHEVNSKERVFLVLIQV